MNIENYQPGDINLSSNFFEKFGILEYDAICKIYSLLCRRGWDSNFSQEELKIESDIFCILCSLGWFKHSGYPLGKFKVSNFFIELTSGGFSEKNKFCLEKEPYHDSANFSGMVPYYTSASPSPIFSTYTSRHW